MKPWDDPQIVSFDFETAGTPQEFALQPWRKSQGTFRATSLVWVQRVNKQRVVDGGLHPTRAMMERLLVRALDEKLTLVGWNTVFDIAVLLAYDLALHRTKAPSVARGSNVRRDAHEVPIRHSR